MFGGSDGYFPEKKYDFLDQYGPYWSGEIQYLAVNIKVANWTGKIYLGQSLLT